MYCRVQNSVWRLQNIDPPNPLSTQRVFLPPAPQAGGGGVTHSPGGEGVGGVNILLDARHWIGLFNPSTVYCLF
jgi:hypothetical protein